MVTFTVLLVITSYISILAIVAALSSTVNGDKSWHHFTKLLFVIVWSVFKLGWRFISFPLSILIKPILAAIRLAHPNKSFSSLGDTEDSPQFL